MGRHVVGRIAEKITIGWGKMEFKILYWYWLVFGMILVITEIFIPSFTVLWFGLGAILVAGVLWLLPEMSLSWQLFIWAVASSIFTILWFKYFKPTMKDQTKAGIAREAALGESGRVVRVPSVNDRGVVRFTTPLLGAEEWQFICDSEVNSGDRVYVKEISGNTLLVEKRDAPPAAE